MERDQVAFCDDTVELELKIGEGGAELLSGCLVLCQREIPAEAVGDEAGAVNLAVDLEPALDRKSVV